MYNAVEEMTATLDPASVSHFVLSKLIRPTERMFLVLPKTLKMGRRNSTVTTEEKVVSCGNERKSHVHKNKRGLSDSGSITHEEVGEICRVGGQIGISG
jgi:hypothetical protein